MPLQVMIALYSLLPKVRIVFKSLFESDECNNLQSRVYLKVNVSTHPYRNGKMGFYHGSARWLEQICLLNKQ